MGRHWEVFVGQRDNVEIDIVRIDTLNGFTLCVSTHCVDRSILRIDTLYGSTHCTERHIVLIDVGRIDVGRRDDMGIDILGIDFDIGRTVGNDLMCGSTWCGSAFSRSL